MGEIIPWWEWRTFGDGFSQAKERIRSLEKVAFKESKEVYILSTKSDENGKVRDKLMDIKSLLTVNDSGLEQWKPIFKEEFPISSEVLERLASIFLVDPFLFPEKTCTLKQFLGEVVHPHPLLEAVDVEKRREIYSIKEATVEIAQVTFRQAPLTTICVEHIDPDLVLQVLKDLGLEDEENVNYIRGMKRSIGMDS